MLGSPYIYIYRKSILEEKGKNDHKRLSGNFLTPKSLNEPSSVKIRRPVRPGRHGEERKQKCERNKLRRYSTYITCTYA